jgi:CDP-diacylglycerol--glycerol-3-phosphate 3-phosphatidyltransferase
MTTFTPEPQQASHRIDWPFVLTMSRLVLAPVIAALILAAELTFFRFGAHLSATLLAIALALFVAAALSDFFDGRIARATGRVSVLGAALDHASDKALTGASLVALAATSLPFDLVGAATLLILRDAAIGGLREGLAKGAHALPVAPLGKAKTVALMAGIGFAIAAPISVIWGGGAAQSALFDPAALLLAFARAALWAAVALSLWSGAAYLQAALRRNVAISAQPTENTEKSTQTNAD